MLTPTRLIYSLRPHASAAILASAAAVATLFAATPFVLRPIAERFDVALGTAGTISTVQVGAFAAATFLAGRLLDPGRPALVVAAVVGIAANLASTVISWFPLLLIARGAVGAAAGVFTWLAWSDAMSHHKSMRDVAVTGPIVAMVASPLLAWIATTGGDRAVFALQAAVAIPAAFLPVRFSTPLARVRAVSPSRSNRILLGALLLLTLSGSSLFIYAATAGTDLVGLGPVAVSLAFSANAAAGIVGTRLRPPRGSGGWWLLGTAAAALTMVFVPNPVVFYAAMILWGVCFWLGIPDTLAALSARSLTPAERAGDAQSLMAVGRSIGPFAGGLLLGVGRYDDLALFSGAGLAAASLTIAAVSMWRARHPVPAYAGGS